MSIRLAPAGVRRDWTPAAPFVPRRAAPGRRLAARVALVLAALLGACAGKGEIAGITATGHVEATEVRLSTKLGGTLEWFELEEGDEVAAGQELARIDTVDLELELATAEAERAHAAARLDLLRAGFRREEIAGARAELERARAELVAAERDLARFQGLLDTGSGTEKSRDDALARRDIARESVAAAGQRLQLLEAGHRSEEITGAAANLHAASGRVAQIEQRIRDARVASPANGVVTESLVERGELLRPGATLAVISELDEAWLTAYLAETDLGRVRLEQEVEVVTDDGQRRQGRLSYISPLAEFTPKNVQTKDERVKLVFRVKVTLDNHDGLFKPGMPAVAHLAPAPAPGGTGRAGEGARQ